MPFGAEQPLLGRHRVEVRIEIVESGRDRAGRLGAIDDDERSAGMGDLGDGGHGQDRARRPRDVRQRRRAGSAGVIAASKAAIVRASSPSSPDVEDLELRRSPVAQGVQAARGRPGARRRVVTARSPGRQSMARVAAFMPSVVECIRATAETSVPMTAATPARASAQALEHVRHRVDVASTRVAFPRGDLGHGGGRLGRKGSHRARIEVDPGTERRDRGPDGLELVRIGLEGAHHGRIIRSMEGWTRPEHLASTAWLADAVDRAGVRIVDARWRPDGSGRKLHAVGHIPGAVYVDWRADLIEAEDDDQLLLASRRPDRAASRPGSASATAPTSSSTTTARACSPRASGGACGRTAWPRSGSSMAASGPGSRKGAPLATGASTTLSATFHPATRTVGGS